MVTGQRIDQREPLGICFSCHSSLPENPDPKYKGFCSQGCYNDFMRRMDN